MKIKITLGIEEAKQIIKKHALKEFPIDVENHDIYVTAASYGEYTIEIDEKVAETEEVEDEKE